MNATLALARFRDSTSNGWRAHLGALGFAAAAILLPFFRDAADVATFWWTSTTFNHCLLIPPIIGWLIWQRLPELKRLAPAAWWPGLLVVGAGALSWLLGEASGVDFARHLGLLLMLQGSVIAILGKAVTRGIAFPLFYAFFLLPVGEEIVPVMQTVTAEIAAWLLALSGVTAHLEGIFITTPTGYFQVAEACAGVRFLIAMLAFGALVANVCYRSWPRRLGFLGLAIVIPILANGVRAWGTIYVAERTGSTAFAESFDHVVYGGVFFAVVIAIILAIGWRFFDRAPNDPWFDPATLPANKAAPLGYVTGTALALVVAPMLWSSAITAANTAAIPARIAMPEAPGWRRIGESRDWQPHFIAADRIVQARYRDGEGRTVDLAVAIFASQSEGRELVGFGQGATAPEGRWAWTADAPPPPDGRAERIASHGVERQVVSFYRVGEIVTGSGVRVKLETMKVRLLGGPQRAVAVLASSQDRAAIDDFLSALGPVAPLADRAAGLE